MDTFQARLARIALDAVGSRGFVLGGGHAIQLHGMAARPSEDIDLFSADRGRPAEVEADVVAAFDRHQLSVTVTRRTSDLVQMMVTGPGGQTCKVDLGIFWRAREPVVLEVGPVLHPDDAAAGKMDALFNRWAPRDFLDVYAIHLSGRYSRRQLEALLMEHNPDSTEQCSLSRSGSSLASRIASSRRTASTRSMSRRCVPTSQSGSRNSADSSRARRAHRP